MPTQQEIIEKFWPKPSKCDVSNIKGMQEAIKEMMDEWAGYLISGTTHVTHTYEIPKHLIDALLRQKQA